MTYLDFQLVTAFLIKQIDFFDSFLNLIFGAFGLFFIFFIAIFVGIFVFAFYMICKSMRSAAKEMDARSSIPVTASPRHEGKLLRESLPTECPECDAPTTFLKKDGVV